RVDTHLATETVTVDIASRFGAVGQAGIMLGMTDDWATGAAYVGLDPDGTVEVWQLANGTWTRLTTGTTSQDALSKRTLRATLSNGAVDVWVGPGTAPLAQAHPAQTITVPATGTWAGLYADTYNDPSSLWPMYDNFTVQ